MADMKERHKESNNVNALTVGATMAIKQGNKAILRFFMILIIFLYMSGYPIVQRVLKNSLLEKE